MFGVSSLGVWAFEFFNFGKYALKIVVHGFGSNKSRHRWSSRCVYHYCCCISFDAPGNQYNSQYDQTSLIGRCTPLRFPPLNILSLLDLIFFLTKSLWVRFEAQMKTYTETFLFIILAVDELGFCSVVFFQFHTIRIDSVFRGVCFTNKT